jgi:metal-responsive CopG/Arc/MetJ family transcriptional regulator
MSGHTLSRQQLAALAALVRTPARKAKTSVSLSGNLLKIIDGLAGASQRSAWIERAVRAYAMRELKRERRARELELLNRHARALNAEGDESAAYQSDWRTE